MLYYLRMHIFNKLIIFGLILVSASIGHSNQAFCDQVNELRSTILASNINSAESQAGIELLLNRIASNPYEFYPLYFSDRDGVQERITTSFTDRARSDEFGPNFSLDYNEMLQHVNNRTCSREFWQLIHLVSESRTREIDLQQESHILSSNPELLQECEDLQRRTLNAIPWTNHKDAFDAFFDYEDSALLLGPEVYSFTGGIVVSTGDNWRVDSNGNYESGGMTPRRGNSIIIYNPQKREFYYYGHLHSLLVRPGEVVTSGQPIGRGGETGTNAYEMISNRRSGRHIHFEIHSISESGENNGINSPSGETWISNICRRMESAQDINNESSADNTPVPHSQRTFEIKNQKHQTEL